MSQLVTLADTKTFLNISGTTYDTYLNLVIAGIEEVVLQYIWDITQGTKTEKIDFCDVDKFGIFLVSVPEVTSITSIEWNAYTGVLWEDYQIQPPRNRRLEVEDLHTYFDWTNSFQYFTIEYEAWYTVNNVPKDIKHAVYKLVAEEFNTDQGKWIESVKLGDKTVKFASQDFQEKVLQTTRILNQHKSLHVT